MATAQDGIFREGSSQHTWLEYDVDPAVDDGALRSGLRAVLDEEVDGPADRRPRLVLAFGPALWSRLAPDRVPVGLHPFAGVHGAEGHHAPATPHALWFWLHGDHPDELFARALGVQRSLKGVARLAAEERGFRFRDSRDLLGFIDGSANPEGPARLEVALVPERKRGAGGSHVFAQRWVHDLAAFEALSERDQEKVIGRTRVDSVELKGRAMPADSHVRRTDIEVGGEAQEIYRRSAPFGTVREHGLYFLGFSRDAARFDNLLASMFGATADGRRDRLLEFSRPTSGALYFAPSVEDLDAALTRGPGAR